jgi:hypothetical protein
MNAGPCPGNTYSEKTAPAAGRIFDLPQICDKPENGEKDNVAICVPVREKSETGFGMPQHH